MWMHSDCIFITIISLIIHSSLSHPLPYFQSSGFSWHPWVQQPLWGTHKPVHYPYPKPTNIRCCQGVCQGLFLTTRRQQERGDGGQRGGREKKQSKAEMGDNCILSQYRWQQPTDFSPCHLPEHPYTMATASGSKKRLFLKEEERTEERLPPFLPRQTCGIAAELSRGHHTHRFCSHPTMQRLEEKSSPPPYVSLALHRLHVNFSHGYHSPTQSSISVSDCLAGRINGPSLEQVLIPLQCTRLEPPDSNILLHQYQRPISCAFCHDFCLEDS